MIADISPKSKREFSALWDNGRFDAFYNNTIDGYFILSYDLSKTNNPEQIAFLEYGLLKTKNAIADMNAFRAAKTAAGVPA